MQLQQFQAVTVWDRLFRMRKKNFLSTGPETSRKRSVCSKASKRDIERVPYTAVQIDEKCRVRFHSPAGALDMSIFTEYISVEVYNQTPKNKLEKYLISGGSTKFSTVCVYRY